MVVARRTFGGEEAKCIQAHSPRGLCAWRLVLLVITGKVILNDRDYRGDNLQGYLDGSQVLLFHGLFLLVVTGLYARAIGLKRSYKANHQRDYIITLPSLDFKLLFHRVYIECRKKLLCIEIVL